MCNSSSHVSHVHSLLKHVPIFLEEEFRQDLPNILLEDSEATMSGEVVVPIPNLYLVQLLCMHCVRFKCIGECF
jgi:hypothetical protein